MSQDQASGLHPLPSALCTAYTDGGAENAERFVAVVSGKGGVGKTNLVANLGLAAARLRKRVLIVDGDLGLSNVDVLLGLAPRWTVATLLEGRCSLEQALLEGPRGVHILPAASARSELAALAGSGLSRLIHLLWRVSRDYDLVLIDAGAGIGPAVVGLAAACRRTFVLTTPEPTSFADAYAMIKVLRRDTPCADPELIVNAARHECEAIDTHARLEKLTRRFLGVPLSYRGHLPQDRRVPEAISRQRAVIEMFPSTAWSRRLLELTEGLLAQLASRNGRARESVPGATAVALPPTESSARKDS